MIRRVFKNLIVFICAFLLVLYFIFIFVAPVLVSSSMFEKSLERYFLSKNNLILDIQNLKMKSFWNLSFDIFSSKIVLTDKSGAQLAFFDNISSRVSVNRIQSLNIDNAYVDALRIKSLLPSNKKSTKSNFKLSYFPVLNIKKIKVNLFESNNNYFLLEGTDNIVYPQNNDLIFKLNLLLNSSFLNTPVRVCNDGVLIYKDFALYANKLPIQFGNSKLYLDGKIIDSNKNSDVKILGNDLPIHDLQTSFLYFQKLKNKKKVFIENFYDFAGSADIDLSYVNGNLSGICNTRDLSAKSVMFDVPIYFKNALFNFKDKNVWAEARGKLGNEDVYTYFILTGLGTDDREIKGHVKSLLSNEFVLSYIPEMRISGKANTSVNYSVKNGIVDISYLVKLDSGSDLAYRTANLGLYAYDRRLFVKTTKSADKLEITHFDYSLRDGSELTNIFVGNGLFLKEGGRFVLQYLNGKTNGFAPISVIGSFDEFVEGGFFDGNLHYNHKKKKITGNFVVTDSNYKDFYLEKAIVSADEDYMNITATGSYDDSPYSCEISAMNDFNKKINIYNMDLFLEEFIIRKGDYKVKTKRLSPSQKENNLDIAIEKWKIKLNKISHKRIVLENILLSGSLKENIFNFIMSDVSFARGLLNANGWYNFNNHSSCIDFSADRVDSNIFADVVLGLPNQISGLASAKLHADTKNKLKDINAKISFSIDEGYMPKLGSTEFLIKKHGKNKRPLKIKLSDIINIDIKKSKALASDINGSFNVDNELMNDINLTSQQKYLSFLIEGDYNIYNQDANLKLWGKYNKSAQRGVKVLFVPLSWIVKVVFRPEKTKQLYKNKIDEIPSIVAKPEDEQAFRVKVEGNINTNNVNVELKSII